MSVVLGSSPEVKMSVVLGSSLEVKMSVADSQKTCSYSLGVKMSVVVFKYFGLFLVQIVNLCCLIYK